MKGIYVVVGAGVLGVLSCMLIVWSLWTRSQARKRARQRQLATGQHAAIPPTAMPPAAMPPGGYPGYHQQQPPVGHTVVVAAPPPVEFEEEPRTAFMSSAELFGQVAPPDEPTQFLSDADLLAAQRQASEDDDEDEEVATTFMTSDELFGRRSDATVVLPEDAIMPEPPQPPAPVQRRPPADAAVSAAPPRPGKPAPAPRYTGFVGDRANDRDDDDDDDLDSDDPETELVHQAELLRLIGQTKRPE